MNRRLDDTSYSWNPFSLSMKEKRNTIANQQKKIGSENKNERKQGLLMKKTRDTDRFDRLKAIRKSKGTPTKFSHLRAEVKANKATKKAYPIAHGVITRGRDEARAKRQEAIKFVKNKSA